MHNSGGGVSLVHLSILAGKGLLVGLWTKTQGAKGLKVNERSFNRFWYKGHYITEEWVSISWLTGEAVKAELAS